MLTYGCLLGALLVSSPLAARHTLRSGAAVGDSRVFRLRASVVVEMRIDLAGMEVRSDRSVVLIPSLCDGERTIALPAVEVEPQLTEKVDFDTFCKSDFRVVKIKACEAVKKSKKLLKFTLNDGERTDRVILSGIHEYYEPEELVGKTAIAIVNLPPRKMMGIDSEGMLISAVHEEDGHEGLNLLMVDDRIPAGAKLY